MKLYGCCLALALAGCSSDLASPFSAVAVTYDVNKQLYKLSQVHLNTLSSLRHLEGTAGTVRAGGSVRVSKAELKAGATVDTLRLSFVTEDPAQVELAWSVLNDIVYPENFDSLELLSAYYNLEKARKALSDFGLPKAIPARNIVAHAAMSDDDGLYPLQQGELYYAPLATFYLPVTNTPTSQLPVVFNLGAVGHALGHELVQEFVWGGDPLAAPELGTAHDPDWNTARHVARSMVEGIGDYLGVAITQDPRWFDHSEQQRAAASALDQVRCGSPDMLQALPADDAQAPYDPFPLGTVIAGALLESAGTLGPTDSLTPKSVLAALPDLATRAQTNGGKLGLADVLDALAAAADDTRKADTCGLFFNRFAALSITSLPACSGVTPVTHSECQ